MSLMEQLITNTTPAPPKVIIYGQPGVGKTTIAAAAGALLVDFENGAGMVPNLIRTPYIDSWHDGRKWLQEMVNAESIPPAIAIDTVDWLVTRIIEHVCVDLDGKFPGDITNTIGTAHGGYFKAREIVRNIIFRDLFPLLNRINQRGAVIILLAHATNAKETTPEGFEIRRASPAVPPEYIGMFTEWVDALLYAHMDGDKRMVTTRCTNVVVAKNRFGMEQDMPLDWPTLASAMYIDNEKEQTNG